MINENDLIPYNTSALPEGPWLVFAPHPDDETFGMGGSLLLASDHGIETTVVILTDGSLGGDDKAIVDIRRKEAKLALKALGVKKYYFWNLPDRGLEVTDALILKVAKLIAKVQPQSVFFPTPMELHPDHRQTAALVWEGLKQANSFTGKAFSYEIGTQGQINYLVDISAVVEKKKQVMALYASQQAVNNYTQIVQSLDCARTYTLPKNVLAAEGFWKHENLSKSLASYTLDNLRPYWQIAKRENPALVSIIIRTKDRLALLQEALQSICEQTYPKIEIIVVNDGGEDVSEVIRSFISVDITVTLVQFPVNMGRSKAANAGLEKATGDYIAFLDDDDWLEPDHINTLVQAIEKHPANKVVYSGVRCVDGDKKPLPDHFCASFDATLLLAGNYIPIHAALFSRELLKLGCRVDESLEFYEDWDFWIQASMFTNFLFVNEYSAVYRIDDSIQQSGLGLGAKVTDIEKASLILFHKWLPRLQGEQLINLMHTVQLKRVKDAQIAELGVQVATLNQTIAERDGVIDSLNHVVTERDGQIASFTQVLAERDGQIASFTQVLAERDEQIASFTQVLAERDGLIAALYDSTSWRITQPLRFVSHQLKRIRCIGKLVRPAIKRGGGLRNTLNKAIQLYRREGLAGIRHGLRIVATAVQVIPALGSGEFDRNDYAEWIRRYDTLTDEIRATMCTRIGKFAYQPLISVVMPVYNPKPEWLIEAIESVRKQIYPHWELCIADDASPDKSIRPILERYTREDTRIKVVYRETNGHISAASNSALELACGEWVALLDHDDLLSEQALFWVVDAIHQNPDAHLIYSDEDKIDEVGRRFDPYFKCDWNVDLFYSHNMITHLGVYRTELIIDIGGFRAGLEGAQDYDLALRCIEYIEPNQIHHIPRVLYHWRMHAESTAQSADAKPYAMLAGERALNEHFQRRSINAKVEFVGHGYRVRYAQPDNLPMVSLIIPTRNGLQLIRQCIDSILEKTNYPNYKILIVDNGSDDPATLQYFDELQAETRVRVVHDNRPFNFSALNNAAVKLARGEVLGLLNNDLEVISPEWLTEMVSISLQPGVGAVGARLWYPDNTLQHGGVIAGVGGVAGHSHKNLARYQYGYFSRAVLIQSFSVVTAACLVIRKAIYEEVGGLNETNLQIAFNDVDFCLRVREAGYRNVWTPYAELYHHESATRGYEDTPEKQARFAKEVQYMKQRWGKLLLSDPAYSPNLTLDHQDFSLAWPPRYPPL